VAAVLLCLAPVAVEVYGMRERERDSRKIYREIVMNARSFYLPAFLGGNYNNFDFAQLGGLGSLEKHDHKDT